DALNPRCAVLVPAGRFVPRFDQSPFRILSEDQCGAVPYGGAAFAEPADRTQPIAYGPLRGVRVLPVGQRRRCLRGERGGDFGAHSLELLGCGVAGLACLVAFVALLFVEFGERVGSLLPERRSLVRALCLLRERGYLRVDDLHGADVDQSGHRCRRLLCGGSESSVSAVTLDGIDELLPGLGGGLGNDVPLVLAR